MIDSNMRLLYLAQMGSLCDNDGIVSLYHT
jgi:hypothetical protein